MSLEPRRLPIDHPDSAALVAAQWQELAGRYGAGDPSRLEVANFSPPLGAFVVGYSDRRPVCCVGFHPYKGEPGVGEIKRMYTVPDMRRMGLGRLALTAIEREASALGYKVLWLVVGDLQPEAIALYESAGYQRRANFGIWKKIPAICMEKSLTEPA